MKKKIISNARCLNNLPFAYICTYSFKHFTVSTVICVILKLISALMLKAESGNNQNLSDINEPQG